MADKYCIASGSWTNTSIWSDTKGGNGGASVPVTADNKIFAVSVTVTNAPGGVTTGKIIVQDKAIVTIQGQSGIANLQFDSNGGLDIDGALQPIFPVIYFLALSQCHITPGSLLNTSNLTGLSFFASAQLINEGTIQSTTTGFSSTSQNIDFLTNDNTTKHRLGRCTNVRTTDFSNRVGSSVMAFTPTILDRFSPCHYNVTAINKSRFETETTILQELSFLNSTTTALTLENIDVFRVYGTIALQLSSGTIGEVVWNNVNGAPLFFIGTNDQTITLPSSVTGQYWTVEKTAGLLDLVQFNGFLQGRVCQLIVRAASSINLSGTPPFLLTSASDFAFYQGLKADATSTGQPQDVTGLLRESLDFCDNYGVITIPAGKVLCTKILRNKTGAAISGNGTVYVRYGGLTNSGNIDPNITVRYFDLPITASFSVSDEVTANTVFYVDLSGSVGDLFRVDWADGTFSETTNPSQLLHVYADVENVISKTLVLTVTNAEGTQQTASQTILLYPQPPPTAETVKTVEMEPHKKYFGVPRGNMPFPYRYALAQGRCFMYDTLQLFCPMNKSGRALENGSGLYLARIAYSNGQTVLPEEIASASYTIYRLDDTDTSLRTPVEGHENISLEIADVLLSETITDENWNFDDAGYNFRHTPDDSAYPPFPKAGRNYLVAYTLQRVEGKPKIQLQYRVRVV